MNTRQLIQSGIVAALLAAGAAAQAAPQGDGDTLGAQATQVQSSRSFAATRAASLASAPQIGLWNYDEGYGAGVQAAASSNPVDREVVRQAAIRAERSGQIETGDALSF